MDSLRHILGLSPATAPLRHDEDEVYPVHMLDGARLVRSLSCTWILRFNDVLDPEVLHTSLSRLLDTGDWRKVGGRIHLKEDKVKLEIHVPRPFTEARPAVSFSHKTFAIPIEDHPVAKTLPHATHDPSLHVGSPSFRAFAVGENAPKSFDDYLDTDRPQLRLHITSFEDTTLVGLSWPHTLMDVMGQKSLLQAWSLVVAGRDNEVPAMLGAREDAVCAALDTPAAKKEEFALAPLHLKGLRFAMWALRFFWDIFCNRVVEKRSIFIPHKAMDKLRQRAQDDLPVVDGQDKPFISDGDILTAWLCRSVALSLPRPRPLAVMQALNIGLRLPSLINAPGLFVQNMTLSGGVNLAADVARGSLGSIALNHREQLAGQLSEAQVLASLRHIREKVKPETSSVPRLFAPPDAVLVNFSNWSRADIFNVVDFSGAVVRAGGTDPPGKLASQYHGSLSDNSAMRNVFIIVGKDREGNYWIQGHLLPQTLAWIEESLREIG